MAYHVKIGRNNEVAGLIVKKRGNAVTGVVTGSNNVETCSNLTSVSSNE